MQMVTLSVFVKTREDTISSTSLEVGDGKNDGRECIRDEERVNTISLLGFVEISLKKKANQGECYHFLCTLLKMGC